MRSAVQVKFQGHGKVGLFGFFHRLRQVVTPLYGFRHESCLLFFSEKTLGLLIRRCHAFRFSFFGILNNAALIGAALPLSAARLPRVAATVAEIPDFQPVVAEKQMNLGGPGERVFKVGEKIPETGPAPIHKIPWLSLAWSEERGSR
jgi:hypothetical protein